MDDDERRRYLQGEQRAGADAEPQNQASGARRHNLDDPDDRSRALLGIPEPTHTASLPGTSNTFLLEPRQVPSELLNMSQWCKELDDHLRRNSERELEFKEREQRERAEMERREATTPREGCAHAANADARAAASLRSATAAIGAGGAAPEARLPPRETAPRSVAFEVRTDRYAASERSVATSATETRKREAELRAAEELAALARRKLQIEEELVQKRLVAAIARIEEEGSRQGSRAPSIAESLRRVDTWMKNNVDDGTAAMSRQSRPQQRLEPEPMPPRLRSSMPSLRREPDIQTTPRRQGAAMTSEQTPLTAGTSKHQQSTTSQDAALDRISEQLQAIHRPPPKQVYELPLFSGDHGEWLTFYNSYLESTRRYDFSNYENVARLRYALKGEARTCVQHLLASATSPELIMRVLKKNFGRTDLLIDRAIEELKRLPPVGPSAIDLNNFAIKVTNIVATLVGLDRQSYGANPLLIREITERLSPHLRSRWCTYARENTSKYESELSMMSEFLLLESDNELEFSHSRAPAPVKRAAVTVTSAAPASTAKRTSDRTSASGGGALRRTPAPNQRTAYAIDKVTPKVTCLCCGGSHATTECRRLIAMQIGARWEWARLNRVCFKCLMSKHRREHCRAKGCSEPGCPHTHNKLLHEPNSTLAATEVPHTTAATSQQQPERYVSTEQTLATSAPDRVIAMDVLLKIIPVIVSGPAGGRLTHALLDEGSTVSLIDEGLAQAIGASGPISPLALKGVGTMINRSPSMTVKTTVRGVVGGPSHTLTIRTVRGLGLRGQRVPKEEILAYSHMRGLESACYSEAIPYILIGADHWHLMVPKEVRQGGQNEPAALRIDLGWVVYGIVPRLIRTREEIVNHCRDADAELNTLLRYHFSIDALGVSTATKTRPEVARAIQIFESTVRRIDGPRYEVGQLWRDDDPKLPANYFSAFKRLKNLESKMDKNEVFAKQYEEQVNNLLQKGYADPVLRYEPGTKDFFLPHFSVTNINKPGKVRLVFDAAAQTQGKSLNDFILEGPDLLQPLPGILLRFREFPYACTADIAEMFLQVYIREADRPSQMFLWRGRDRDTEPRIYRMRSMNFGAASSPYLAHSVRNKNAKDNAIDFPLALNEIQYNHYMDDFVSSFRSESECIRAASEVAAAHERGGFSLRGWASNSDRLLRTVPEEMQATQPTSFGDKTQKILGMLWNSNDDSLRYNTQMLRVPAEVRSCERVPTKREVLSAVMSVFDPLGLISQYLVTAKIQLQRLWALELGWDQPLPEHEAIEFQRWLRAMDSVAELQIPRQICDAGGETKYSLHIFVDASAQAYAVAAYWRAEGRDGVKVSLAAAKAKVAPTKPLSIPRLELQAALIGARLQATIMNEQRLQAEDITIWSDSKTVLLWVKDDARRYNPYVAHRLGEIAELTDAKQWRYVPTRLNPADDGTRADPDRRPHQNDRWYVGPAFLQRPPSEWPHQVNEPSDPNLNDLNELKKSERSEPQCHALTRENPPLLAIERFSSYERLVRATARVLQFVERLKSKRPTDLELRHIKGAEHLLYQHSQRCSFPEELRALNHSKTVSKKSKLYKLDPELCDDGLLRMRGRINAAPTSNLSKKPIILDGRDPFVRLLILNTHRKALHANNERVVNDLRQMYWIVHLRPSVRSVALACQLCAIRRATPRVPALGDLPTARMQPFTRPYTYSAVDYMGPVNVTIGRRHEKRWIALFTCLTTRAVWLEIVSSLSTDSAIMALRRFGARRGYPRVIYSDNATCFRGADHELKRAYEEWLPHLKSFSLTKRMEWRFIPPGAPNQGGAWERLVRSVKTALAATLNTRAPKEEVLKTLLAEAENCINARPLTYVSVDPKDPEALTPHHFLLSGCSELPEVGPCNEADRRIWRATQALADHFWSRWVKEYLPTLAPRQSSPAAGERQLQPGDIVVIIDPALPRNVWPLGVVETTFPGPDGAVRSADVRTKGGVFRRPTRKLAVLPVQPEVPQPRHQGGEMLRTAMPNREPDHKQARGLPAATERAEHASIGANDPAGACS